MALSESFRLTPITNKIGASSETFHGIIGRKEMATLWWKACPNECEANLPHTKIYCASCRILRRYIGLVSRKMVAVENNKVIIHKGCKRELIELSHVDNTWYLLNVGPPGRRPWMRFRVDVNRAKGDAEGNEDGPGCYQSSSHDKSVDKHRTTLNSAGSKRKRGEEGQCPRKLESTPQKCFAAKNLVTPSVRKTSRDEEKMSIRRRKLCFDEEESSGSSSESQKGQHDCTQLIEPGRKDRRTSATGHESHESPLMTPVPQSQKQETQESESMAGPPQSWVSLPLPRCGGTQSSEEESLIEESQFRRCHRVCAAMTVSDWKEIESKSSGFKSAVAALIVARNSGDCEKAWLPPLLRKDTEISF